MPNNNEVTVVFQNEFNGTLTTLNESNILIGMEEVRPYDMVYGALISCFHATYLEILTKKHQTIMNASYHVSGIKRTSIPHTLEHVVMQVVVGGVSDMKQSNTSFELAKKYCSVFQTISMVASIEVMITYM